MSIPLQFAALLVVAWLPGAVLLRLPFVTRDRPATLSAEERWFWQIIVSLGITLWITMLLALAGRYTFGRLLAGNLVVAVTVAAAARFKLGPPLGTKRPGPAALIPLTLLLLAAWRFSPAAEYVIGGKDPGVYMNEGIQIAQRGGLVIRDKTVAEVPPSLRNLFFPSHQNPHYYSLRFMAFFIQDPDAGLVVGQFPHLFPASIAIGYGIDGLSGARRVAGFWATLGILGLYFLGARLIGRTGAAAAAALLALHVLQVWYARYPNSEIMMQPLLLAALLASDRALEDEGPLWGPVAGVLLGLQVGLRVDIALAVAAVGTAVVLRWGRGHQFAWSLIVPAAALAIGGVWYLIELLPGYAYYPVGFTRDWILPPLLAGAVIVLAVLLWTRRQPTRIAAMQRVVPLGLIVVALSAIAYGWFFRTVGNGTAVHDAEAMRTFTRSYFTLPAFLAALGGYAIVVRRRFWAAPATLLTITTFAWFFFYKIRVVPEHFWMGRRLVPVILPGLLLLAAGFATAGLAAPSRTRRIATTVLGLAFLVLLAGHYSRTARPVLDHVEYAGLIPRLETLAGGFADDDLVLIEARDASDVHVLGLPVTYIYGRNVLVLASAIPDKNLMASFLEWAQPRFKRVLFFGSGGTDLLSRRWTLTPIASERFTVPEYERTPWNSYPRAVRQKEFDYGIYQFSGPQAVSDRGPFELDLGAKDDLHVVRFHSKEQSEGRSIRWTGYNSQVAIMPFAPESRAVTVWMSNGGRPATAGVATVRIYLAEQLLGEAIVEDALRPYVFAIPPAVAAIAAAKDPPRLRLQTNVWTPQDTLGTGDDRQLGVMVDRIVIR